MSFKKIEISDLDKYKGDPFEGYLWYSDQQKPKTFNDTTEDLSLLLTDLPFVVEGRIFYPTQKRSLHIQNMDGEYLIGRVELNDSSHDATWPAHRMESGITKLKIKIGSALLPDPLNPPFKVNTPSWRAFVGFETK